MPNLYDLPHSIAMRNVLTELFRKYEVPMKAGAYIHFEKDGGFMPFYAEMIGPHQIAIAHTYVQEGDLMYDPEIVYYIQYVPVSIAGGSQNAIRFIPFQYQNSGMGIYQEAMEFDEKGAPKRIEMRQVRDMVEFSKLWAENLKWQLDGRTPDKVIKPEETKPDEGQGSA